LLPGEEIQIASHNRPGDAYDPFVKTNLRGGAAGLGISYESFSKDYSTATYSSARSASLEERKVYRDVQRLSCRKFNNPIYRQFIKFSIIGGLLNAPGYMQDSSKWEAVKWQCPGWEWVDPLKDGQAAECELGIGATTLAKIATGKGEDWEDLLHQRKRELDLAKTLGLDILPEKKATPLAPQDADGKTAEGTTTGGKN
jgi:lambda family phage portal protein